MKRILPFILPSHGRASDVRLSGVSPFSPRSSCIAVHDNAAVIHTIALVKVHAGALCSQGCAGHARRPLPFHGDVSRACAPPHHDISAQKTTMMIYNTYFLLGEWQDRSQL